MYCKSIINAICNALASNSALSNITVISEFPAVKQDVPLQKAVISVGLEGVEITGTDTDVAMSVSASPVYYKFGLSLCVPKSKTGTTCHDAVDKVLTALKSFITSYKVTDITVGEMKYSGTLGALTVPITLRIYKGNAY